MKKEILTKEIMKKETLIYLKKLLKQNIILFIISTIVLSLFSVIVINLESATIIFKILLIGLVALYPFLYTYLICRIFKKLFLINKNKFNIITDELIEIKDKVETGAPFSGPYLALLSKPHRLRFLKHGEYSIPQGKHYVTSQNFCMDAQGVYNYSNIHDTFYLFILNKNEILTVYNSKLFELV